jgi:hypothetical protein
VSDHISCNLRLAVRQEPVYGQQFLPHLQSARPGQCARWFPLACLLRETDEPPLQDIPVTSIKVAGYVDGQSVKSCTLLAVQCDGGQVDTVEGLAQGGVLHAVQEGFYKEHGLQCGFCTPGMLMRAARFLQENPNPSEDEIRMGMSGNLCRCTGYQNIIKSIQYAAKKLQESATAAA